MKNPDWIDAKSACAVLGVKAQTLYAYVSRHQIRAKTDPNDARQSLYAQYDIDNLSRQKRRPRARAEVAQAAIRWGDPVMPTSISEVRDGTIYLRGQAIEQCADTMSLEQVAAWLCDVQTVICPTTRTDIDGTTPFARAMKILALDAETAVPMQGRDGQEIAQEAGRMISLITEACLGQSSVGPIHERVGAAWGLDGTARDVLRRALVLLSDHELNPSTFAVRVCASTGGSLAAALLAGMATLSGPKHGGVASLANSALLAALQGRFDVFLEDNAQHDPYVYGFGHPLYPEGDPRAVHLLRQIPRDSPSKMAVRHISERIACAPNIDAALAVFTAQFGSPPDAATTIFSIGRAAGWVAHAIEQVQSGTIIRPRAKYQTSLE